MRSSNVMVGCCTASLKTPTRAAPGGTLVAPAVGVVVTVGLVVSGASVVKDQETGSIALPAPSWAPLRLTV